MAPCAVLLFCAAAFAPAPGISSRGAASPRRAVDVRARDPPLVRESVSEAAALRLMARHFRDTEPLALGMDVDVFKVHGVPCAIVQHHEGYVGRVVLNRDLILTLGARPLLLEQITRRYTRLGPHADLSFLTAS